MKTIYHRAIIFHILIGLGNDMTRFDFGFTRLKVNQKTENFVYHWLHALAMFDVTCIPTFVGSSDVISGLLSIRKLLCA